MTGLVLSLLGRFTASLDDGPTLKFRTKRALALLAYLAAENGNGAIRHRREELVELLWPGFTPKSARSNLRQTLYYLHQSVVDLPEPDGQGTIPFLLTDRSTVQVNPAYPIRVDVVDFERLLDGPPECWPEAIDLYQGDFLADFYLPDANPFEEWAAARQAAYRRLLLDALETLTTDLLAQGEFEAAEGYALRQLEIDNLRESAYRHLMQLYAWSGRQAESLSLYQECVQILEDELASPPDETTTALYEAIRQNQLPAPPREPELLVRPEPKRAMPPTSPYRGLFAFREEDAAYFFGREAVTDRLVETVKDQPVVAVIGPSGSGKSSVLQAGLVAQLRQEGNWTVASFRPGNQPFQALAAALVPLLEPEMTETERMVETRRLAQALVQLDLPLNDVVDRIQQKLAAHRLLLLADHFEELYTLGASWEERRRFIDSLLDVVKIQQLKPEPYFTFALAFRADFLDQVLGYRPLADAIQDGSLILGSMSQQELAEAIEKPAEKLGVAFEAGLVRRILTDVGHEPGNLPLLEFALTILWERQSERQLTHGEYDAIGGVEGALTHYADEVFEGLEQADQERAHRIFIQLVRPGRQTNDTRRLSSRMELGEENWALAQRLADARLVVIGRDPDGRETVELVHETLIRSWDRLKSWLEEDRSFRLWQERLRAALAQWGASDEDEGALLRGAPLAEAEGWLAERRAHLSPAEVDFIEASGNLRDRREAEREEARAARERTRRLITIGLAVGLILAIVLAAVAAWQWNSAREARLVAEGERDQTQNTLSYLLASQAQLLLDDQLDLALLLAVEAFHKGDSLETRSSLLSAVSHNPSLHSYLNGHTDQVRTVVSSPDGQVLATGGDDEVIRLWDLETGQPLAPPLAGHSDNIRDIAFSPDGQLLASGSFDGTVILWDVTNGEPVGSPLNHEAQVWSVAFSSDGQWLVTGAADGKIRFWDASSGQLIGEPYEAHNGTVAALAFGRSGNLLASAGRDDTVFLWEVLAGKGPARDSDTALLRRLGPALKGHSGLVRSLAFSPDGQILAMDGDENTILLWDVTAIEEAAKLEQISTDAPDSVGKPLSQPIFGHDDWVTSLAFGANNTLLASAGSDGQVILWDITPISGESGTVIRPESRTLVEQGEPIWDLVFSPDDRTIITGGADGRVTLWDMTEQHPLARQFPGPASPEESLAFNPGGRLLVAGGRDNTVTLYDVDENSNTFGQAVDQLNGHANRVLAADFSPDGRLLATADRDGLIFLWDVETGKLAMPPLIAHQADVFDVAFSPNGQLLVSSGDDGSIHLWDVNKGQQLVSVLQGAGITSGHDRRLDDVFEVTFSPQGEWLASGGSGGEVILWDLGSLVEYTTSKGNSDESQPPSQRFNWNYGQGFILALAFSPDGRTLASGSNDGEIFLRDVASGELIIQPLAGHKSPIWGLDFSSDGDTMVSASDDGRVIFWNTVEGSADFGRPYGPPLSGPPLFGIFPPVTFSEDGRKLASITALRDVILWDISVDSWLATACSRANRNLTQEEWGTFFGNEPYRLTCPDLPPSPAE
jgi:WD40 repeat protein/DNA-binding SARP family transcriptional activator/energy-coupling factor transporter ATP-binding protein EcfA2